jgi:hypothetical protein
LDRRDRLESTTASGGVAAVVARIADGVAESVLFFLSSFAAPDRFASGFGLSDTLLPFASFLGEPEKMPATTVCALSALEQTEMLSALVSAVAPLAAAQEFPLQIALGLMETDKSCRSTDLSPVSRSVEAGAKRPEDAVGSAGAAPEVEFVVDVTPELTRVLASGVVARCMTALNCFSTS